jgi:hypothetical protein
MVHSSPQNKRYSYGCAISRHKSFLFVLLCLLVFPAYVYHNQIRVNLVRWDAIYANWPSIFYLFRPYTVYAHVFDLVFILFMAFIGYGLGVLLLRWIGYENVSLPSVALAIPFGWAILSYVLFFLALSQILNRMTIALIFALFLWASYRILIEKWKELIRHWRAWRNREEKRTHELWIYILLIAVAVFFAFVSSLMPPTQSDGLRYHVTVPKLYLQHGGFVFLPNIAFSNFPFLIEYLFLIPLAFDSISGPKLIHFCYFLFTLILVYRLGKAIGNTKTGVLAALLLATTPFVPIFASWSFIEFGLTCYMVLGLTICVELVERLRDGKWESLRKSAILLGIAAGLAVSCKYTALTILFFFAGAVCLAWIRRVDHSIWRRVKLAGIVLAVAGITASPWFVKNAILLGNPLYPFARNTFPTPHWSEFNATFFSYHAGIKGNLNAVRQLPIVEKVVDFLTLPIRITLFHGDRRETDLFGAWPLGEITFLHGQFAWLPPDEGFGSWPLGAIWLILLPLILLDLRWNRRMRLHLLFGAFLFLLWAYTYRDTRFLLPSLAVIAPLYGKTAAALLEKRPGNRCLFLVVILYGLSATTGLLFMPRTYEPWLVVSGKVSKDDYLERVTRFEHEPNQAFRFLRENTKKDDLVLLHGIDQPFYCPNRFIGADWFNTDPLIAWSWESMTVEQLVSRLREEGIRYVVHDYGKIRQYFFYYRLFRLPPAKGTALLREFVGMERTRVRFPYLYLEWQNRFQQRLAMEEDNSPNIKVLHGLLEGRTLNEVFRYDKNPTDPHDGIVIMEAPSWFKDEEVLN